MEIDLKIPRFQNYHGDAYRALMTTGPPHLGMVCPLYHAIIISYQALRPFECQAADMIPYEVSLCPFSRLGAHRSGVAFSSKFVLNLQVRGRCHAVSSIS